MPISRVRSETANDMIAKMPDAASATRMPTMMVSAAIVPR
jgi:hypothetical protein